MENETKKCKYCSSDIPKDAKICPMCRRKQKGGKLGWIIGIFVALIIIGALGSGGSNSSSSGTTAKTDTADTKSESVEVKEEPVKEEPEEEVVIEYIPCDAQTMFDDLKNNAMKAQNTYKDSYIAVTGYLSNIDASGKYISIDSGDEWSFNSIQCYIKTDDVKDIVMNLNKGDKITVKGKCTDVGEILGYSIDIDSIEK